MLPTMAHSHQTRVLQIFKRSNDGRLSAGELKKKLGGGSKSKPDAAPDAQELDRTLAGFIEDGLIAVAGGTKEGHHPRVGASYRLTEKGRQHLRPTRPDIPDEQLQAQEAFILLQVFRAKEQKLTRSELNGKLRTKAAVGQLEFDVKESPLTVDYHLDVLVDRHDLIEEKRGNSISYSLDPERGPRALASVRQHDGVSFTLSGETLNALLTAARQSAPGQPVLESPAIATPGTTTNSKPLGSSDIANYIEHLRADKYAGKDLIPIHALRQVVAEHHGDEAASHPVFDRLIKRMRSEEQLELIAISDNRDATQKQLDDSIPGMNETLFYVVIE